MTIPEQERERLLSTAHPLTQEIAAMIGDLALSEIAWIDGRVTASLVGVQRPEKVARVEADRRYNAGVIAGLMDELVAPVERERLGKTPWARSLVNDLIRRIANLRAMLAVPHTGQRQEGEDDKLSQIIAAKMKEPVFVEMQERDAANINWPRYLTVQKVGPTAVSDWIVRLLPSGREIHLRGDEWDAARTSPPPPVAESGWQEIESAPKDGSEVLLCNDTGCRTIGEWNDDARAWVIGNDDASPETNYLIVFEANYWRPLPAPPHIAEKREVK